MSNFWNIMEEIRNALVADCDAQNRESAAALLEANGFSVQTKNSGRAVLQALACERFDFLLLSLVLRELDGFAVLERLPALPLARYPYIAVSTAMGAGYRARALALGADEALAKPLSPETLLASAEKARVSASKLTLTVASGRMDAAKSQIAALGVPARLKGFDYLACAVALCSADDRLLSRATTLLYPRVAAQFDATSGGVEHAVRQAIETTWTHGRMETLSRLFGNSIDPQRGKPTNTECIALLAEQLRKAYE